MGDRMLAAPLGDHRHLLAIGARPAERGIDGAVRRHRASGRDREIAAVDAVRGELLRAAFMRLVVLGGADQPAGALLDAMHDPPPPAPAHPPPFPPPLPAPPLHPRPPHLPPPPPA